METVIEKGKAEPVISGAMASKKAITPIIPSLGQIPPSRRKIPLRNWPVAIKGIMVPL